MATTNISERHRHRYEVNTAYRERLGQKGLVFAGMSPDGLLPETIEFADHPWFIGVQFHPELKSRPFEPHPLFASFIAAAMEQSGWCRPRQRPELKNAAILPSFPPAIPFFARLRHRVTPRPKSCQDESAEAHEEPSGRLGNGDGRQANVVAHEARESALYV